MIDLNTDSVLHRHEIPASVANNGLGLASLTIDVIDCESDTFAYLPDLEYSQIIVFNLKEKTSYRVRHNYFRMHPFQGEFDVDGLKFSWEDAIFSITLSERERDSTFRLAYFHPMSRFDLLLNAFEGRKKIQIRTINLKILMSFKIEISFSFSFSLSAKASSNLLCQLGS